MDLHGVLEGILFVVGDEGISLEQLRKVLNISDNKINDLLSDLMDDYDSSKRGFKIKCFGNKYKLITKVEHKEYYEHLLAEEKSEKLSQAALETLAVIAYNGPVTRLIVDEIRGVDSSHMIRKLLLLNLIKEAGRSDLPGKPRLYSVTDEFLDYLGLSSVEELPKLESIEIKDENIDDLDLYESKYKEN